MNLGMKMARRQQSRSLRAARRSYSNKGLQIKMLSSKSNKLNWLFVIIGFLSLIMLLTGCAQSSSVLPDSQATIPALSPLAIQPERRSVCLPTSC